MRGFIMTQSKQVTKPSAVVYILTAVQQSLAHEVAVTLGNAHASKVAYDTNIMAAGELFAELLGDKPTYKHWLATRDAVSTELQTALKFAASTVKNLMSDVYADLSARGIERPKADSASAKSMSAKRAELAAIPDNKLAALLDASVKAEDFKKVVSINEEIERREKVQKAEAVKLDKAASAPLKADLKKWVQGMNSQQLAALVWVRENWESVASQAN